MPNIATVGIAIVETVSRSSIPLTTSTITKKIQIVSRGLNSTYPSVARTNPRLQIARHVSQVTTCFTPEIVSASQSNIPTGFTFGYVAGVPYISIMSVDETVTYMTIYGNSGIRQRLSTAWQVPAGVTQVRVRIGSGGSKAQAGKVISLSQPKLEFDPQDGSYNGPTGYTPGRP